MAIVVFLIFLNAVPGLMLGMGIAEDMGYDPSMGGDDNVKEANEAIAGDDDDPNENGINPSGGFGGTLFTLYTSLGGTFQTIMGLLIGGELMLITVGVPDEIVFFLFAPKYILVGAGIIYVLAGRRL